MRKLIAPLALGMLLILSNSHAGTIGKSSGNTNASDKIVELTDKVFKEKIFNYEASKSWKFEGNLPVIIDFYATWCGPCKVLSPLVEEAAKKYEGKILVYKVDTDKEPRLAQSMGIQSLPTLFFIPVTGQPRTTVGSIPRETLEKAINEILLVK